MRKQLAKVAQAIFDSAGFSVRGSKHSESTMPYDLGDSESPFSRPHVHLSTFDIRPLPPPQKARPGTKAPTESAPSTQAPLKMTLTLYFDEAPDLYVWLFPLNPYKRGEKFYALAGKGFRLENSGWKPPGFVTNEAPVESALPPEYRYPLRITLRIKGHYRDTLAKLIFALDEQKRVKRLVKLAKGGVVLARLQRSSGARLLPKQLRLGSHAPNVAPSTQKLRPAKNARCMLAHAYPSDHAHLSPIIRGNGYGKE